MEGDGSDGLAATLPATLPVSRIADMLTSGDYKSALQLLSAKPHQEVLSSLPSTIDTTLSNIPWTSLSELAAEYMCYPDTREHRYSTMQTKWNKKIKCEVVWTDDHIAYRCDECGVSSSSCMCTDCFDPLDHQGHKYRLYRSASGGCCDCGDDDAWKPEGCCQKHRGDAKGYDPCQGLPEEIYSSAYTGVEALMSWIGDLLIQIGSPVPVLFTDEGRSVRIKSYYQGLAVLLQCIENIACVCSPYRRIVCNGLTRPRAILVDSQSFLHQIIRSLPILNEGLVDQLGVIFLKLLFDPVFKAAFSQTFSHNYSLLIDAFALSASEPAMGDSISKFLDRIFCQLFHSDEQVLKLASDVPITNYLMRTLHLIMSTASMDVDPDEWRTSSINVPLPAVGIPSRVIDFGHPRFHGRRAYQRLANDLKTILSNDSVGSFVLERGGREEDVDGTLYWGLQLLTVLQCNNLQKRAVRAHVGYENENWQDAFNLEYEVMALFVSLVSGYKKLLRVLNSSNTPHAVHAHRSYPASVNILKKVVTALLEWTTSVKVEPESRLSRARSDLTYSVSFFSVSFHIPLHRFFGMMLYEILSVVKEDETGMAHVTSLFQDRIMEIAEHPLRVLVLVAQIESGHWVRNGFAMNSQVVYYYHKFWVDHGIDLDIMLLQMSAFLSGGEDLIYTLMCKFELSEWFALSSQPSSLIGNREEYLFQKRMAERMLHLVYILAADRRKVGANEEELLQQDIIQWLATGDKTFSEITKHIPNRFLKSERIDTILANVADYIAPLNKEMANGKYTLKDEMWSIVDPYFIYYRRADRESASQNYNSYRQRERSKGESASASASASCTTRALYHMPGIKLKSTFPIFSTLPSKILSAPSLMKIIFCILNNSVVSCSRYSEELLSAALYVLCLALDSPPGDSRSLSEIPVAASRVAVLHSVTNVSTIDDLFFSTGDTHVNIWTEISGPIFACCETEGSVTVVKFLFDLYYCDAHKDQVDLIEHIFLHIISNHPHDFEKYESTKEVMMRKYKKNESGEAKTDDDKRKQQAECAKVNVMDAMRRAVASFQDEFDFGSEDEEGEAGDVGEESKVNASDINIVIDSADVKAAEPPLECVICRETSTSPFCQLVLVQRSPLMSKIGESSWKGYISPRPRVEGLRLSREEEAYNDRKSLNVDDGSAANHFMTCGHHVHYSCFDNYFKTLENRSRNRETYEGQNQVFVQLHKEFLCPLCRRVGNTLMPIISPSLVSKISLAQLQADDACDYNKWIQDTLLSLPNGSAPLHNVSENKNYKYCLDNSLRCCDSLLEAPSSPWSRVSSVVLPSTEEPFPSLLYKCLGEQPWFIHHVHHHKMEGILEDCIKCWEAAVRDSSTLLVPLADLQIIKIAGISSNQRKMMRNILFSIFILMRTDKGKKFEEGDRSSSTDSLISVDRGFYSLAAEMVSKGASVFQISSDCFKMFVSLLTSLPVPSSPTSTDFLECLLENAKRIARFLYPLVVYQALFLFTAAYHQLVTPCVLSDSMVGEAIPGLFSAFMEIKQALLARGLHDIYIPHEVKSMFLDSSGDVILSAKNDENQATVRGILSQIISTFLRRLAVVGLCCLDVPPPDTSSGAAAQARIKGEYSWLAEHFSLVQLEDVFLSGLPTTFLPGGSHESWFASIIGTFKVQLESLSVPNPPPTAEAPLEPSVVVHRRDVSSIFHPSPYTQRQFQLVPLPHLYAEIYLKYCQKEGMNLCSQCNKAPTHPALCLMCYTLLCCATSCCSGPIPTSQYAVVSTDVYEAKEVTSHAFKCGKGYGAFLLLHECQILLCLGGNRVCFWGSLYLDKHGEEDRHLKRGEDLYLNAERYSSLNQLMCNLSFLHDSYILDNTHTFSPRDRGY